MIAEGKTDEAVRMLKELNAAEPSLRLNPEQEIRKWTASIRLAEAEGRLKEHKIAEAAALFAEVEQMDTLLISAKQWNDLCRKGAALNFAPQVLFACDNAVAAAQGDDLWNFRDNRGLARALTGDIQRAIKDFKAFVEKTGDEALKKQRQAWIAGLEAGQNPFTKEVLASLRRK